MVESFDFNKEAADVSVDMVSKLEIKVITPS